MPNQYTVNPRTVLERIESRCIPIPESGCWIWEGATDSDGYGHIKVDGIVRRVYVVLYELDKGPIPPGLQPDHLCRVKPCINPSHLELVTSRQNTLRGDGPTARNARKTHCKRGHAFTPDNIYRIPCCPDKRQCRTCIKLRSGWK